MDKPWLFLIVPFCSLFILAGLVMMIFTGRKILHGVQARHWPQAMGRVLSVESKDTSTSESTSREIQVRYAYSVHGRDYEGGTIHPTYGGSSVEQAHRGLESLLKPGQSVSVFYDAANPERCTLSVGFYSGSLALFFGGCLFFGAGLGFLLTFWFALAGDWDVARGISVIR